MKFKVGDRIKIANILEPTDIVLLSHEEYLGAIGTVIEVHENVPYPYSVIKARIKLLESNG